MSTYREGPCLSPDELRSVTADSGKSGYLPNVSECSCDNGGVQVETRVPQPTNKLHGLQNVNQQLMEDNDVMKQCIVRLMENADLRSVNAITMVMSQTDDRLRNFLSERILANTPRENKAPYQEVGHVTQSQLTNPDDSASYGGSFKEVRLSEIGDTPDTRVTNDLEFSKRHLMGSQRHNNASAFHSYGKSFKKISLRELGDESEYVGPMPSPRNAIPLRVRSPKSPRSGSMYSSYNSTSPVVKQPPMKFGMGSSPYQKSPGSPNPKKQTIKSQLRPYTTIEQELVNRRRNKNRNRRNYNSPYYSEYQDTHRTWGRSNSSKRRPKSSPLVIDDVQFKKHDQGAAYNLQTDVDVSLSKLMKQKLNDRKYQKQEEIPKFCIDCTNVPCKCNPKYHMDIETRRVVNGSRQSFSKDSLEQTKNLNSLNRGPTSSTATTVDVQRPANLNVTPHVSDEFLMTNTISSPIYTSTKIHNHKDDKRSRGSTRNTQSDQNFQGLNPQQNFENWTEHKSNRNTDTSTVFGASLRQNQWQNEDTGHNQSLHIRPNSNNAQVATESIDQSTVIRNKTLEPQKITGDQLVRGQTREYDTLDIKHTSTLTEESVAGQNTEMRMVNGNTASHNTQQNKHELTETSQNIPPQISEIEEMQFRKKIEDTNILSLAKVAARLNPTNESEGHTKRQDKSDLERSSKNGEMQFRKKIEDTNILSLAKVAARLNPTNEREGHTKRQDKSDLERSSKNGEMQFKKKIEDANILSLAKVAAKLNPTNEREQHKRKQDNQILEMSENVGLKNRNMLVDSDRRSFSLQNEEYDDFKTDRSSIKQQVDVPITSKVIGVVKHDQHIENLQRSIHQPDNDSSESYSTSFKEIRLSDLDDDSVTTATNGKTRIHSISYTNVTPNDVSSLDSYGKSFKEINLSELNSEQNSASLNDESGNKNQQSSSVILNQVAPNIITNQIEHHGEIIKQPVDQLTITKGVIEYSQPTNLTTTGDIGSPVKSSTPKATPDQKINNHTTTDRNFQEKDVQYSHVTRQSYVNSTTDNDSESYSVSFKEVRLSDLNDVTVSTTTNFPAHIHSNSYTYVTSQNDKTSKVATSSGSYGKSFQEINLDELKSVRQSTSLSDSYKDSDIQSIQTTTTIPNKEVHQTDQTSSKTNTCLVKREQHLDSDKSDVIGVPLACSTPKGSATEQDNVSNNEDKQDMALDLLVVAMGMESVSRAKYVLHRAVDTLLGYKPDLPHVASVVQAAEKLNTHVIGEISFQLDRRILEFVFKDMKDKMGKRRSRYYGYSVASILQLIDKEVKYAGDDVDMNTTLRQRLEDVLKKLQSLGYRLEQHAEFAQDMVNLYGLLNGEPDPDSLEYLAMKEPAIFRVILGRTLHDQDLNNMLVILDCLLYMAYHNHRPMLVW